MKHPSGLTPEGYSNLLKSLRKDLQLDATTDLLPGTLAEAVANDTGAAPLDYTAATLVNSWATAGGSTPGYAKDQLGFVHMRGRIAGGTTATTATTLPAGFRPGQTEDFAVGASSGTAVPVAAFVQVQTSGVVTVFFASAITELGLVTVTFLAQN